mgnify:CR=1 FL=1
MQELLENITNHEAFVPMFFIFVIGGLIAISAIFMDMIKSTSIGREREKSRREIAAYIAEGSMSPEDGERLLNAGQHKKS